MKKFQLLVVALAVVCSLGVLAASSASAAIVTLLAEWLVGGEPITTALASTTEGELLLEETVLGIKLAATCSGNLIGTIGANGEDKITELLSLASVAISKTGLAGEALSCTNETNCAEPLVWAVNLPWNSLLVLFEEGTEVFFADYLYTGGSGNPGWEVECMGSGQSDTCLANVYGVSEVKNGTSNVEGTFSEAFRELAGQNVALCTLGGETGLVVSVGAGTIKSSGTPLTVSSTG